MFHAQRLRNRRAAKATAQALDDTMKRLAHQISLLESTACAFAWDAAGFLTEEQMKGIADAWVASLTTLRDEVEAHRASKAQ